MGGALLDSRPSSTSRCSSWPRRRQGSRSAAWARGSTGDPHAHRCGPAGVVQLSLAVNAAAREAGLQPDYVGGHSLGEYTAAGLAGAMSRRRA